MIKKGEAMDIWSLHRQGLSFREIGRKLGLDRRTVKKYIENQDFPVYARRARQSKLAPYYGLIRDWLSSDDYTTIWIYDRLKLQIKKWLSFLMKSALRSMTSPFIPIWINAGLCSYLILNC